MLVYIYQIKSTASTVLWTQRWNRVIIFDLWVPWPDPTRLGRWVFWNNTWTTAW